MSMQSERSRISSRGKRSSIHLPFFCDSNGWRIKYQGSSQKKTEAEIMQSHKNYLTSFKCEEHHHIEHADNRHTLAVDVV